MSTYELNRILAKSEYDYEQMKDIIHEQQQEIDRLNNIINELEKWSEEYRFANIFENKLQELKEVNK